MSYRAEISRSNPTCFLFLIDQSASMADPFGGEAGKSKAENVSDALNRIIKTIVLRCAKQGGIRDYFHLGVIGYGKSVGSMLKMPASSPGISQVLMPVSVVAPNPLRVEDRTKSSPGSAGGQTTETIKFPVWIDPLAAGETPMCQAFDLAWQVVNDFLTAYPDCYPPLVINITDGAATDGDPEKHSVSIRDLASNDGNVLLLNCHVSSRPAKPVEYPDREAALPDDYARLLFRMSSVLPPELISTARADGFSVSELSRGFVFNADLDSLVRFLDIGTRVNVKNLR